MSDDNKNKKIEHKMLTISREYGSGGRIIGSEVAKELGIPFYDKELISLVAKESGFSLDFIEESGEYTTSSLLFNVAAGNMFAQSVYSVEGMPIADKLHLLQNKIVLDIARKEPSIIVGRSADYILEKHAECLNVFIYADKSKRAETVAKRKGITLKEAEKEITKKDKGRANQYKYYSGKVWGSSRNYHLCLDSEKLGSTCCAHIIANAWREINNK